MNWQKYGCHFENGRFWRIVLQNIEPWRDWLDIYSIDCIKLESTQEMLGLWSPYKDDNVLREIMTKRLDSYPAWATYENNDDKKTELENAVRQKLKRLTQGYLTGVSFLNVRAYHECIQKLSNEFRIVALPRRVDWKAARAVPYRNIDELKKTLQSIVNVPVS
jgi:hypothetical protein